MAIVMKSRIITLSTARFGWSINMQSIQEEELGSKWGDLILIDEIHM